jgi:hypothetical protein
VWRAYANPPRSDPAAGSVHAHGSRRGRHADATIAALRYERDSTRLSSSNGSLEQRSETFGDAMVLAPRRRRMPQRASPGLTLRGAAPAPLKANQFAADTTMWERAGCHDLALAAVESGRSWPPSTPWGIAKSELTMAQLPLVGRGETTRNAYE